MQATKSRIGKSMVLVALAVGILTGLTSTATAVGSRQSSDMAEHPLVGAWLALIPFAPDAPPTANPTIFTADGHVIAVGPITQAGAQGLTFGSNYVGTWERTGERSGAFTMVKALSDANGTYLGTLTVEGFPTVSDDGQIFTDDAMETKLTVRDPAGNVVSELGGDGSFPHVTATRVRVGSVDFSASASEVAASTT